MYASAYVNTYMYICIYIYIYITSTASRLFDDHLVGDAAPSRARWSRRLPHYTYIYIYRERER